MPKPRRAREGNKRRNQFPSLAGYRVEVQEGAPAAVLNLQANDCRFPVGRPLSRDFKFCRAAADFPGPYCAIHSRLCSAPPRRR
jgi:hypothetical protein